MTRPDRTISPSDNEQIVFHVGNDVRDLNWPAMSPQPILIEREYLSRAEFMCITGMSGATLSRRLADRAIPKYQPAGPGTWVGFPRDAVTAATKPTPSKPEHALASENARTQNARAGQA